MGWYVFLWRQDLSLIHIFWAPVWLEKAENSRRTDRIYLFDSLYRFCLQRPIPAVQHGVWVDYAYCIIAMAVITAIYVILGGYMATAINDFIQGIIMLAGIVAVVIFA